MRKEPRPRFLTMSFSLVALLVLILSACGGTPSSQSNSAGTVVKGGTFTDDLYEDVDSLIPNGVSETYAVLVDQAIWAPLFYGDSKGIVHPGLASEIPTQANGDVSQDLKTWTIKLKPNLVWSDGQPLNADDVNFTWKLWVNPKFGAYSTAGYNDIKSADVSADKLSITFHLSAAYEPFVALWTDGGLAPLPAHHFASMAPDTILKSPDNLKPSVVSGPFSVSESVVHDHFTLAKNPKYYLASQGYPYLDKIVFRFVTDSNTILKDLQAGTIDASWFLDVQKTSAYQRLSNYTLTRTATSAGFEAIWINENNPILKDVNIRKALAMAIDHNALIQTARRGAAVPLCTDHPSGVVPGYEPNAPCPKFDPTAASALLQSNGWTPGPDGVRTKGGQRLEFQYSTTAKNAWRAADELILQANFKAIGVKIDIQNYPAGTFFGNILPQGDPKKYQLAEFEQTYTYDGDDSTNISCSQVPTAANNYGGGNFAFYCNHALDPLFQQELGTTDTSMRQDAFNKLHAIFLTDFPFITEYGPIDEAIYKNNVHNYTPGPMGAQETVNVWSWWCTGGAC
ncbi:MAG TPA: peptide ABC transporter substrate-binding protein [Ktedonobacteraceae bacterium]